MGKRENAIGLYMDGIRDGNPREAVARYTGDRYTQHSTGVADGQEGFIAFFEPFIARNPKRDIEIVRGIEDGRYVFVQAFQSLNDGEAQWVTTDLFDTDEEGTLYYTATVTARTLSDEDVDEVFDWLRGDTDSEAKKRGLFTRTARKLLVQVAPLPRLSITGSLLRPAARSREKFCMFRAPIWITSAYCSTSSSDGWSTASVMIRSPVSSRARASSRSASSPSPWKL